MIRPDILGGDMPMMQLSKEIQQRARQLIEMLKEKGQTSCSIELYADQQASGRTGILTTDANDGIIVLGSIKEAGVTYHIGVLR